MVLIYLFGCVQRHEPFAAPRTQPVDVAPVFDAPDAAVLDAPDPLDAALLAAVRARRLEPRLVPTDRFASTFARRRETAQRLGYLAGPDPLLLVETRPRLFGLVRGHWKWVVETRISLGGLSQSIDVPVFLANPGDDADDAVIAATPEIARRTGELIDRYLAGL